MICNILMKVSEAAFKVDIRRSDLYLFNSIIVSMQTVIAVYRSILSE